MSVRDCTTTLRLLIATAIIAQASLGAADKSDSARVDADDVKTELRQTQGLCILIGTDDSIVLTAAQNENLLGHYLASSSRGADEIRSRLQSEVPAASLLVEHWTKSQLPHADNLANLIVLQAPSVIEQAEVERVLCPGGVGLLQQGNRYLRFVKSTPDGNDTWTHQWHGNDGSLVSADQNVGVPQGVQWLSGPLFAMSGRKSSTQTLVSAGGINFYVTQNVEENVGLPKMNQYLLARDAYNGLILWQRPWTGPFVTGDGETNPRMVASNERLYVAGESRLMSLNTRTGETLAEVQLEGSADLIVLTKEQVIVQSAKGILALDLPLSNIRWQHEVNKPTGLVIFDERIYCVVSGRSEDGRFKHELICLDANSGQMIWRQNTQPHVVAPRIQINFVQDGVIALQAHGYLHVFSTSDGTHLWTRSTEARPGKDYVDERYVGHFYNHGLVWMLMENSPRERLGQSQWIGLNPTTGNMERELTTSGPWPRTATPAKMGCQVLIASDKYIMIPRQATFIDFKTGAKQSFKFARGGCGLGFVPANGLVYSHPHACGCFSEAIRGFMGMHSTERSRLLGEAIQPLTERLETFSELDVVRAEEDLPDDWPIYRGNAVRSGFSPIDLSPALKLQWSLRVAEQNSTPSSRGWKMRTGNPVTPTTLAGDTVYVAAVDSGRLLAVDIHTGAERWSFQASGRIDSPPTIYRNLCLFGAHDGYVYCLHAASGRLVWRYRAAPVERRIVAFGNIESAWPVAGSVLVQKDIALVAAGRAPDADGGIEVHALDPYTGSPRWSSKIYGGDFNGLCDYMIGGKDAVFLSNWQFDPLTGAQKQADASSDHLRGGKVGLLETSWTKHDLALRKDMQTWTAAGQSGQLLAFSPTLKVAYRAEERQLQITGAAPQTLQIIAPEQITALALSKRHIIIAGGTDRSDCSMGGFLRLIDASLSQIVHAAELAAEPVFDGIALAPGRILVSTQNGEVHCFTNP